jgi:hypothetical protein
VIRWVKVLISTTGCNGLQWAAQREATTVCRSEHFHHKPTSAALISEIQGPRKSAWCTGNIWANGCCSQAMVMDRRTYWYQLGFFHSQFVAKDFVPLQMTTMVSPCSLADVLLLDKLTKSSANHETFAWGRKASRL